MTIPTMKELEIFSSYPKLIIEAIPKNIIGVKVKLYK